MRLRTPRRFRAAALRLEIAQPAANGRESAGPLGTSSRCYAANAAAFPHTGSQPNK